MYELIGYDDLDGFEDEELDAIAGMDDLDELDDEELEALASGFELVGMDPGLDELDDFDDDLVIAGLDPDEEDFDDYELAVSGYYDDEGPLPGSVEELLEAGATAGRGRRRRGRRRPTRRRGSRTAQRRVRSSRARSQRTRRVVRGLGQRLRRERARTRRAVATARRARSARSAPRPARTIRSVTGGKTQLVPTQPQTSGPQVVPFTDVTPVAPGETRVLTARPQVVFRPNQLIVAGRIAEYFRINAVRIGNQNQFAASGAVPAEAFTGVNPMPIGNTTAHPGHDIAIEVTNISASPQEFSAAMSGPALQ